MINRIIPSQPSGIEYNVSEPSREPVSNVLPRCHAPLIPIRIPSTVDRIVAVPTRSTVGQTFSETTVITGRPEMNEYPNSPRRVSPR